MILSIAGVQGGADLSANVERDTGTFEVDSAVGKRMDTFRCTMFDPTLVLAVPDRAEIWVYDAPAGGTVVDPPGAISAYNTFLNGASPVTDANPLNWTTRLFAGYVATPRYAVIGPQRFVGIEAQDYTYRLRSTVCNKAYVGALTDKAIIQDIFGVYRKDVDVTNVNVIVSNMPAISFPVHSLEQFMERIIKISRGIYRVDYYKRLFYGAIGQQLAPFGLSDTPNGTTTLGMEEPIGYAPDGTGLANQVWVVGARYLSLVQSYQVPPTLINGSNFQFTLPGDPDFTGMTVTVAAVDQGVGGVIPAAGDITSQASYKNSWVIQHLPAILALKTTPTAGQAVIVTGKFRYPLVSKVSAGDLIALTGGNIFESIIRDRRINDLSLAQQVGNAFLRNQGLSMKGGTCTIRKRGQGGAILQPGQQITITHTKLFAGGVLKDGSGNPVTTMNALVTRLRLKLDTDSAEPYAYDNNFADRQIGGGY
jgi:subtilisin family serine protease